MSSPFDGGQSVCGAAAQAVFNMLYYVKNFTTKKERDNCTNMKEVVDLVADNLIKKREMVMEMLILND